MMIARVMARCRRLRTQLLTMTRPRRMRAILPGSTAQSFPRWLPVALHWRPASRRAPPTAPRAQTVSHLHLMATHLHAQLQVFAGGTFTRTIACARGHASPERFFRSIAGSAPLPWRGGGQLDVPKTPPTSSSARALSAQPPGIRAPTALRFASGHEATHRPALLTSPELRRAGAEKAVSRDLHGQPLLDPPKSAASSSMTRLDRLLPHIARIEQRHFVPAQRQDSEPPPRMTHAPAFSRPPELIWQKDRSSRADAAQEAASSEPQVAGRPAMPTAADTTVAQSPSQPERPQARKPMSLSDLEPSFVDRLAEDVIRRVERRARIERERRGL
jgi:hypothetical protein